MIIYNSVITEAVIQTRLHGQAVKTSPFHGGNTGSIPVGVISLRTNNKIRRSSQVVRRGSATPQTKESNNISIPP